MSLPPDCLKFFAELIEREIGIVYSEINYYQLQARLEDIAKQLELANPIELWDLVRRDSALGIRARSLLLDTATNNETSFFRDPNVFKAIEALALEAPPGKYTPSSPMRIWSAACSTGQEIYSLAIMFASLNDRAPFAYTIDATDFSRRVLRRAEAGRYTDLEVQRGLTPAQLTRFMTQEQASGTEREGPTSWVVKPELKRGLSFRQLNLLEPWQGLGSYHLILCRNVLIYQTVDNKKKVVAKMHEHMEPDAALVLGGAESLIGVFDDLSYQTIEGTVVYRKGQATKLKATG